jgi:hypothetical protein
LEAGAQGSPTRRPYHVTRPVSRVLYHARRSERGDGHSSWARLAAGLMQPTRAADPEADWKRSPAPAPPLFGLAPGGVCRAALVAKNAVRSYRTLSPLPATRPKAMGSAVCFLWHCPWGLPRRRLSGTVLPWSPDFPPRPITQNIEAERPSGPLTSPIMASMASKSRPLHPYG